MLQNKPTYLNKSKRQRLKEKKAQKFGKKRQTSKKGSIELIEIQSSDNQAVKIINTPSERIVNLESESNKDESEAKINIEQSPQKEVEQTKVNQFNYARLTKLAALLENKQNSQRPLKLLDVVQDEGCINGRQPDIAKAYTFHVEGSKDQKSIRKVMLKDRATQAALVEARNLIQKKAQQQKQVVQITKDDEQESDDFVQDKKSRYFAVSHELCYRCGKQGHYAVNCLEEWVRKCKNCFSRQHDERNCPQTCFECGNVGHISSDCVYRSDPKCQKCLKKGHTSDHCGMIIWDKYQWRNIEKLANESDLKKLKCIVQSQHTEDNERGHHYNCFEYKLVSFPYQELRVNTNTQDNVSLKDYQSDSNRRSYRYDNRRPQSRQSSYGTNYGGSRVMQHYRSRYNDVINHERSRGQDRSFEYQRHRHSHHSTNNHRNHGSHSKNNGQWKRNYYM